MKVLTMACHVSNDAGSPDTGACAERAAAGADRAGIGAGAVCLNLFPNLLNMSRESRRGANTAAPPISTPGMSAASTNAAPAVTAPRSATLPTTPDPKAEA
jgi:hypothetical protein